MHRLRRIPERPLRVVKLEARKPAHILRRVIERAVYARAVLPTARKRAKHRLAAAKRDGRLLQALLHGGKRMARTVQLLLGVLLLVGRHAQPENLQ